MDQYDETIELSDAVILCAGKVTTDEVTIHTADKQDAETLYAAVEPIAVERSLDVLEQDGLHREFYLELADSEEHSLDDEDSFEWNTRPIWELKFEPTSFCQQRMYAWADENKSKKAPTDFKLTPTIVKVIYYSGAHEMSGEDGNPYIEFVAADSDELASELEALGMEPLCVEDLWRLDEEDSARFRAYGDIPVPKARKHN